MWLYCVAQSRRCSFNTHSSACSSFTSARLVTLCALWNLGTRSFTQPCRLFAARCIFAALFYALVPVGSIRAGLSPRVVYSITHARVSLPSHWLGALAGDAATELILSVHRAYQAGHSYASVHRCDHVIHFVVVFL
jgi:hypothetical protein